MKFKVGDRVQFKSWEEMEKEFGLNNRGYIKTSICFTPLMEHLCGTFATILSIGQNGYVVYLKDFTAEGRTFFAYTLDMLKPAKGEKKYRVGDKVQYNGSTYVCDGEYIRKEDTDKYELHIMSDGKKTTAVYKKNGEIVSRSEANLHPDDEFNFKTGAQIAFDRVFQPEPEKKELIPALYDDDGECYGEIGKPTKMKDKNGRPLFIGDVVYVKHPLPDCWDYLAFVVRKDKKDFITLIPEHCHNDGSFDKGWSVALNTPFNEVLNREKHHGIVAKKPIF